jgi:hypothetical protein
MNENEDKIIFNVKSEVIKDVKSSSEVPDYGDEIIISNPNKYFLYCEGKTEEKYFKRLRNDYFNSSRLDIQLFKPNQKNHEGCDAKSLACQFISKKKIEIMDKDFKDDENQFFLIFDRDNNCDEPVSSEEKHLDYCLRECTNNSIKPIFSNPCFEVWLICQFEKPIKTNFPERSQDTKSLYNATKIKQVNRNMNQAKRLANAKRYGKEIFEERINNNNKIELYSKESYPITEIFKLVSLLEKELDII